MPSDTPIILQSQYIGCMQLYSKWIFNLKQSSNCIVVAVLVQVHFPHSPSVFIQLEAHYEYVECRRHIELILASKANRRVEVKGIVIWFEATIYVLCLETLVSHQKPLLVLEMMAMCGCVVPRQSELPISMAACIPWTKVLTCLE
jgi:hypothetical protein